LSGRFKHATDFLIGTDDAAPGLNVAVSNGGFLNNTFTATGIGLLGGGGTLQADGSLEFPVTSTAQPFGAGIKASLPMVHC
jgi:hypothetical protein